MKYKIYELNTHNQKKFNKIIDYFADLFEDIEIKARIIGLATYYKNDYVKKVNIENAKIKIQLLLDLKELGYIK